MKTPAIFATVLLAASSVLFAADPAQPSEGGKPKSTLVPLAGNDKKFVKDVTEGLFFVMDLIGQAKTNAQTKTVQTLGDKAKADFDKVWADVAGYGTNHGEESPKELKGADKSAAERLKKTDKKNWDKEFLKTTSKEVKKMAHAFKDAKGLSTPELQKIATDWGVVMTGYETDWDNAEKELAKAKPAGQ